MKPKVLQAIRWVMPSAAVLLTTGFICNAQLQLDAAKEKKDRAEKALAAAEEARDQILNMGNRNRFAAQPVTPTEEAKFLDGLKRHVNASGASIIKWTSTSTTYMPPEPDDGNPQTAKGADPVLVGLSKVTSQLTLAGDYASLRSFLHNIAASPRLYTFSDVRWTRDRHGCLLALNLSRYIAPAASNDSALTVASAGHPQFEVVK